jgi:hypothetical protein
MQIGDTRGHADLGARVFAKNGGKQQRTAGNSKEQRETAKNSKSFAVL